MQKLSTGEARDRFAEVVNEAAYGDKRIVITRHGKDLAAVVPIADLQLLHELERLIDVEDARKALAEIEDGGVVTSLADLKKELAKK